MDKIVDVASNISQPLGIAGILAAATLLIFREIIRRNIFPQLTKNLSADIIKLIIKQLSMLALVSMILGFAGFAMSLIYKQSPRDVPPVPPGQFQGITFRGRIIDARTGRIIRGARIRVNADDKLLTDESDSKGMFVVRLQVPIKTADFRVDLKVEADNYIPFFEHDLPAIVSQQISLVKILPVKTKQDLKNQNQDLSKISPDRSLSGIEMSFKPSREHWAKIVEALKKTKSLIPDMSSARMTAERIRDYWVINFAAIKHTEGTVSFPQISTDRATDKAFEDVLREALIGLSITWGGGAGTELEPSKGEYPATISVSQDKIAFSLRPPEVMLKVATLEATPTITFRGKNYPTDLRIVSLDPGVALDQTLHLDWKSEDTAASGTEAEPAFSGPHRLNVALTSSAAVLPNDNPPPKTNSCDCADCGGLICCANPGQCLPCGSCGPVCCSGDVSRGVTWRQLKAFAGICFVRN